MRQKALLYRKRHDFLTRSDKQPDALKHPSPCRRARTILLASRHDRQTFPYFFLFRTCRADYQPPFQPQAKTCPARYRQNQRMGAAWCSRGDAVLVFDHAVFQTHSRFVLTEKMPSETHFSVSDGIFLKMACGRRCFTTEAGRAGGQRWRALKRGLLLQMT